MMTLEELQQKADWVRRRAFEIAMKAGEGHLGGVFSCVEILVSLYYGGILRYDPRNPKWPERDRFILSKGHSNLGLYIVLADTGFFNVRELDCFLQDGSMLGGHCDNLVPGIEAISGSLGHGLGICAGIALGNKLAACESLTFVTLGDGECQEGSVWESALFASHHGLNRLIAVIDRNRLGSEEFTEKSLGLEPFSDKWKGFGWEVREVDGHAIKEIISAFDDCRARKSEKPLVIIAHTRKGKGISCLEGTPPAHHTMPYCKRIIR